MQFLSLVCLFARADEVYQRISLEVRLLFQQFYLVNYHQPQEYQNPSLNQKLCESSSQCSQSHYMWV